MGETITKPKTINHHHRELGNPAPYDTLIPAPYGFTHDDEVGNTYYSLRLMKKRAKQFASQAQKLAQAKFSDIPTLEGKVKAIRDFLYNQFQYSEDPDNRELIRSIAESWSNRKQGIDCKDFSVAASQILQNLGIAHYFRKIKQADKNPGQWSHVYVVVPVDQSTPSLNSGYHVIDPVPEYTHEAPFTDKYDKLVMKQHRSLAGTATQQQNRPATAKDFEQTILKHIEDEPGKAMAIISIFDAKDQTTKNFKMPKGQCSRDQLLNGLSGLGCDCSKYGLSGLSQSDGNSEDGDGGFFDGIGNFISNIFNSGENDGSNNNNNNGNSGGSNGLIADAINFGSQIYSDLSWDEEAALENLITKWVNNNYMQISTGPFANQELGVGRLTSMTPDQLKYWLNITWPREYDRRITSKDWGDTKQRVIDRYDKMFGTFKKMAQDRLSKSKMNTSPTSQNASLIKNGGNLLLIGGLLYLGYEAFTGGFKKDEKDEK